jgi:hypothetical protein
MHACVHAVVAHSFGTDAWMQDGQKESNARELRTGCRGSIALAMMRLVGVIMLMSCTVPSTRVTASSRNEVKTEISTGWIFKNDGNLIVRMGFRCGNEGSNMRMLPLSCPVRMRQGLLVATVALREVATSAVGCVLSVGQGSTHMQRVARFSRQWYVSCSPYLHPILPCEACFACYARALKLL